jgi:hypothetical protein
LEAWVKIKTLALWFASAVSLEYSPILAWHHTGQQMDFKTASQHSGPPMGKVHKL